MAREIGNQNRSGWNGMDKLQGEQLSRAKETSIILVNKVKSEDGEEIGEYNVNRKVGVCVVDKIQPARRDSTVRRGIKNGLTKCGPVFWVVIVWPFSVSEEAFVVLM